MASTRLSLSLVAALLTASAVAAQDPAQGLIDQLRAQGYVTIDVSQTLLGRTRIVATGPSGQREIVFNPATGEIVRDLTTATRQDGASPRAGGGET